MKMEICESCSQEIAVLVKFCNWCGNGPKLRKGGVKQRSCKDCHEMISPSFSYCPWCGEDFNGNQKPRQKAKGFPFDGLTCPACEGPVLKSMEYCPWCSKDLKDNDTEKECPSCGASIGECWQHCIYCGSFTEQIVRLSTGYTVTITREALFFLALATAERHLETRRHFLLFKKTGFETYGYVFGSIKDNCFTVKHLYPIASVKSRQESVTLDDDNEGNINRVIKCFKVPCKRIGVFHNHSNDSDPYPSICDYECNLNKEQISVIVAIEDATKRLSWQWNAKGLFLEGN